MSQQDVQVMKALLAAFNDRDIEAALLYAHPEIEIRPSLVGGLEQKVYRGTEGFRQFGADIEAAWEEFSIEPVDFRSTPDGVLVLGNARARGRESGIRLSAPAAWLAEVRAGRVYRFRSFTSHEEALEAVGLSE